MEGPHDANAAKGHQRLGNKSSLPPDRTLAQGAAGHGQLLGVSHQRISRTVSDSYGQNNSARRIQAASSLAASRRKLESEDSSYDSDHEGHFDPNLAFQGGCLLPQQKGGHQVMSKSHVDVSRTPSETLGAEFAEHVTLRNVTNVRSNKELELDEQNNLEQILRDPTYNVKVEYALRLGYSESLLQRALIKLGHKAAENQILEELIRLQKSKPESSSSSEQSMNKDLSSRASVGKTSSIPGVVTELLPIVVDGSNLAMSHGNKDVFSCKGIQLCVAWFQQRGHRDITVFVPKWRKESPRPETPITEQSILTDLEKDRLLSFTPSRQVLGKRFVCHDDRYILNYAADTGAIVVSNDNYRDLLNEKPEYKKVVEERILMYSFVNDRFMPPDDPMGRNGPTLDQFLRRRKVLNEQQPCPYGKKCTYGNKCKFYHADRGAHPQKSITDKLKEHSYQKINEVRARGHSRDSSPGDQLTRTKSLQPQMSDGYLWDKQSLCRTRSNVPRLTLSESTGATKRLEGKQSMPPRMPPSGKPPWLPGPPSQSQQQLMKMIPPPNVQHEQFTAKHGGHPLDKSSSWTGVPFNSQAPVNIPPPPLLGGGAQQVQSQGNLPDTSMPPPAPRGPWSQIPAAKSKSPCPMDEPNQHRKLARQLTLNPSFDPRIHHLHNRQPPFPMHRTDVPPPNMPLHATVTRNSSAPEPCSVSPFESTSFGIGGDPTAAYGAIAASGLVPECESHAAPSRKPPTLQRMSSTSDSQLHKTVSDLIGGAAAWEASGPPVDPSLLSSAVSPLIGSSDGVWETSKAQGVSPSASGTLGGTSGDAFDHSEARSKLYYHLAAVFPESQVLQAMRAMPEETNPQKICSYIIFITEQQNKGNLE